jgi:hypothetical protein
MIFRSVFFEGGLQASRVLKGLAKSDFRREGNLGVREPFSLKYIITAAEKSLFPQCELRGRRHAWTRNGLKCQALERRRVEIKRRELCGNAVRPWLLR